MIRKLSAIVINRWRGADSHSGGISGFVWHGGADAGSGVLAGGAFGNLEDRDFLSAHGFLAHHLLYRGDPRQVRYSFLLLERTPEGNALRVDTDNLEAPFDINDGLKLELGSTAKLRTLSHYLELVASLHRELRAQSDNALKDRLAGARDPITRWAVVTMLRHRPDLESFLNEALDRKYSGSPYEAFFTGGGLHTFANFESNENGGVFTVREGAIRSINLVFIRLMRDLVQYHEARLPYDPEQVLENQDSPLRRRMLTEIAERESKDRLAKAYATYANLPPRMRIETLLGRRKSSIRHLAILFFAWNHDRSREVDQALQEWLQVWKSDVTTQEVGRLVRAYGSPRLNISDYGYLLGLDPLDVWCAGELQRDPGQSWSELWQRSTDARKISSAWLFKTRNRPAQDRRLRIRFEQDAFRRMTPYWQRLGFPFDHLVPSYASAIGSSSDRPAALAELMGIILNDGLRLPTLRIRELTFGAETPYRSVFKRQQGAGERVILAAVAHALRGVLQGVVDRGTARRIAGAFVGAEGKPVPVGGKTGSGDNRYEEFSRGGTTIASQPVSRTAAFVFYIGDRFFGVMTAYVVGSNAGHYSFISALPVAIVKQLAPVLNYYLAGLE